VRWSQKNAPATGLDKEKSMRRVMSRNAAGSFEGEAVIGGWFMFGTAGVMGESSSSSSMFMLSTLSFLAWLSRNGLDDEMSSVIIIL
jgi:hypothetical protein